MIRKIISGGQTGVDRAGLNVAIELGIPYGGWAPKWFYAEDGVVPSFWAATAIGVPCSSAPQIYRVSLPANLQYLAKTSAESTHPMMFPRCGTLFTYGNADVISTFFAIPIEGVCGFIKL